MRPWLSVALVLLLECVGRIYGRYNLDTCWPNRASENCIKRNKNTGKGWCYYPDGGFQPKYLGTRCTEYDGSRAPDMMLSMHAHMGQNVSIGYYLGGELLGDVDWPVPEIPGNIRLCMSGLGTEGIYRTICIDAPADNTLPDKAYGCYANYGQQFLTDGCYLPPPTVDAVSPNGTTSDEMMEIKWNGTPAAAAVLEGFAAYTVPLSSVLFTALASYLFFM